MNYLIDGFASEMRTIAGVQAYAKAEANLRIESLVAAGEVFPRPAQKVPH